MTQAPGISLLAAFADPVALAIVGGGTIVATLLRAPMADVGRALRALAVVGRSPWDAGALATQVEALSRISARHGVMQLDRSVIADRDVSAAIAAIVDGTDPDTVAAMIDHARTARHERHRAAADVWAAIADIAPAMGLVGTLIGLVRMFLSMTDPKAIGAAMAIALLTTLYGAIVANLVAMPIAARLRRLARAEYLERGRLIVPLSALARREAPRQRERAA